MFHHKLSTKFLFPFFLVVAVSACKHKDKPKPDAGNLQIDFTLKRFDSSLFQLDTTQLSIQVDRLKADYPGFLPCYFSNIMNQPGALKSDTTLMRAIQLLRRYGGIQAAYDSVMQQYANISWLRKDLRQAFTYSRYYFPDSPTPEVFTFVSEYGFGVVNCGENQLGIGLDLFLGPDFKWYPVMGIPQYMTEKLKKEYIVPNTLKAWYQSLFGETSPGGTLLDQMIHQGKLLYLIEISLPEAAPYQIAGYTPEQGEWATENEAEIWKYFKGEDLLYETSRLKYMRYITDGPGTPGMPPNAPGNMGSWVGWQIVRQFMDRTQTTPAQLMKIEEGQTILQKSGYKPR